MASDNERHIIISVDLDHRCGVVKVDLGSLSPMIAYHVLQQALDAVECVEGPDLEVIHDGRNLDVMPVFGLDEDKD